MPESPLDGLVGHEIDTVSFVRDYVELRIEYSIVRALTDPSGSLDGIPWRLGDVGSTDTMRRYIGKTVVSVEIVDDERISLVFDGGATFDISLRPEDRVGAEAAHFMPARPDGTLDTSAMCVW